jgi:NhaA family Na+:H+ antiporter
MAHQSRDYLEDVNVQPSPIDLAIAPFANFIRKESAGGIVLLVSTLVALVLANSPVGHIVHEFWTGTRLTLNFGSWVFPTAEHPAHLEWWVNDALMAAFFFVVGLELKREFLTGELREPRKAALPLVAAVGGMLVPAAIYFAFNAGSDAMNGWAIPMATDIAFALGVLALLGPRVPPGLRVFLVTLAIIDDLGALIIIAFFYTSPEKLNLVLLGLALVAVAFMAVMNVLGVRRWWIYGLVGLALWAFVLQSGVHPTIAGVLGAMTIPVRTRIHGREYTRQMRRLADEFDRDLSAGGMVLTSGAQQDLLRAMERLTEAAQTPLQRLERGMVPLVAFLVVPVFALANAGVSIGDVARHALHDREAWGIVLGLTVGKTLGIAGFSFIAVKLGFSVLPRGVNWQHVNGAAMLGGIGFTMSLFIAHLAFGGAGGDGALRLEIAKLAVLCGSTVAAALGALVLATAPPADTTKK